MNWSDEHFDTLRTMAIDGFPASAAAVRLGTTRSAVLGAAHRKGITFHGSQARPRKPHKPTPMSVSPAPKPPPVAPPAPARPCSLLELGNESCRWVISAEGEPFVFCGALEADMRNGMSYCRTHARMAYRRPGEREEAA